MLSRIIFYILIIGTSAGLVSCNTTTVYDTMQDLDSNAWSNKQELKFPIVIKDPSLSYRLYYSVRYDNNYPYYNLYINRTLEDSAGKQISKKLQGMDLFKENTGMPKGSGMGAKKDYLIISEDNYKFPYAGTYTIKLQQYMRQENVAGISAVGFKVEKVTSEK